MAKKLGKVTQQKLNEFDAASQQYGFMSDQGSPLQAQRAAAKYQAAKAALTKRLIHLEQQIKLFDTMDHG